MSLNIFKHFVNDAFVKGTVIDCVQLNTTFAYYCYCRDAYTGLFSVRSAMTIGQDFEVVRASFFGGSACVFLNASLVIYIVAFASPFWFDYEGSYHLGLWSACYAVPNDGGASQNSTVAAKPENRWECIEASKWIDNAAQGNLIGSYFISCEWKC